MADVSRLINDATGKSAQVAKRLEEEKTKENVSPAENAARLQAKFNWRTSTITQEMFAAIGNRAKALEKSATDLACNGFTEEERIKVTHLLIKARALRDIILEFATED